MAPYQPPNAHYSQMDVSEYDEDHIFGFIGKTGKRFYWLTKFLGLDYLWYDKKRKVIEIWGPYHFELLLNDTKSLYRFIYTFFFTFLF